MSIKPIIYALFSLFAFGMVTVIFAQTVETGKFILYKYQRPMGTEVYQIQSGNGSLILNTKFNLSFVGDQVELNTTLQVDQNNFIPQKFLTKGSTSTRTHVDTTIEVLPEAAKIQNYSQIRTEKLPEKFFTILHPAPIAPQMLLFRFWHKNKIAGKIPLLPGGAAAVEYLGKDTITISGKAHQLDRYAIEGVMWGREIVWFDQDAKLIALVGADAEMDRFEAVREGFEDRLSFFVQQAAADTVGYLERLSRQIKPLYQGTYAITGGLLIGGKDFETVPDSVIVVENGKITAAGHRREIKIPKNLKVFDAQGKTILPGLFDMHAHATQAEWFPASLAAGITTMRDAANELEFIVPVRDAVDSGKITVSPRLLLAGYIDSGENSVGKMKAETPAEARAIVRQYKAAGFQQIKIYQSLKPELVKVVTDQAHQLGMTVTGHIPRGLNIYTAVDNGYDQINHLGFAVRVMTPRDFNPQTGERQNSDPESEAAKDGFRFLREHKIVIEPTLARGEISSKILGDSFAAEPGTAKIPFEFATLVESMGLEREAAEKRQAGREFSYKFLKALHEAGIPLIVGTDLVIPGHTEYREIELFVKAGISPLEAIKAATIVPAKAMNLEQRLGTIEAGKLADLIVLDANPLEAISNIRRVKFVVKDGKMFDTAPLWRSVNFQP